MNERFKKIREEFGFSQEKFGEIIGLSKSGISNIESGQRKVTEKHIKLLSSELNINPDWIRTGEGTMKISSDTFSLDEYAKQRQVSDLELDIIKLYFELDPDTRRGLLKHFKDGLLKDKPKVESEKEDDKDTPSNKPTLEELDEEYKKMYSKSVSKQDVSVSSGIEGDINKVV